MHNGRSCQRCISTSPHPRLPRSFMMEYDIHTLLDLLTAAATAAVLFAMLGSQVRSDASGRP